MSLILYHFAVSPFSRRVRLALSHKGLAAELREPRAMPEYAPVLQALNPLHTAPVLVDGEHVVADSSVIVHYLDRKYPERPLFPQGLEGANAIGIATLTDAVLNILVDLGIRVYPLHEHANFAGVRTQLVGRAQRALDALARKAEAAGPQGYLCGDAWTAADMVLYTAVAWLEGLPARAEVAPVPRQVLALGFTLPQALSRWADAHRTRPEIVALG